MNFEHMPLKKAFWRFIWPSVIAQWIFALYTMVDGMFVARGVSEVALSAVNIASPFVNFLFSVSILFAVGTSTIVAICLGKGEKQMADEVYTQSLAVLAVVSLAIMLVVFLNLDAVSVFLGATETTMEYVKNYILSILPFSWCFIIAYSFEILVKTDGYPKFATVAVTTGAVMNCILDYLFVFVFRWGVAGAGAATGLSQCALVFIYLSHFLSPKATIRFRKFRWDFGQILRSVKIGMSSCLTEFSAGITVFLFNHTILEYLGNDGIISYTIIAYVNTIVVMSLAGIAQGAQPMVSFYYGRGEKKKYMTLLKYGIVTSVGLGIAAYAASAAGADLLVSLFISRELTALREYSAGVFRIFALSFLIMGVNIQMGGFFTAVERPQPALAISLGRGVIIIAIALKLCTMVLGGEGIWLSQIVSEILCCVMTGFFIYRYRKQMRRGEII
ncbi:MATE family efflux transporter [Clostridium sp. AN503]|uniref:MATE family efflux transporter n=1 Tax=Clostridium sp. AN503 TaxID=3160598 RepID=UPI003458F34C